MKTKKQVLIGLAGAIAMLIMLLDTRTAVTGAAEGIKLCIYTVVPALFPFIVTSTIANALLIGTKIPVLTGLGKLCKMPIGTESLVVLGLLGGYPVGAACIGQAYNSGQLHQKDAKRLLGFCSNAGPGFIFGMTSALFTSPLIPWIIWGIQIISSILTGILLREEPESEAKVQSPESIGITKALNHGLRVTAVICGWVIMFRIVISFSKRWFLWLFPTEIGVLYCGMLELTNGCVLLKEISQEGLRLILCSAFLSFGGVCVLLQTISVSYGLGCNTYINGKILQSIISFLLSYIIQFALLPQTECATITPVPILLSVTTVVILSRRITIKKSMEIMHHMMYNKEKIQ